MVEESNFYKIRSLYSDYFGFIDRYQKMLLSFNNLSVFYIGSVFTVSLYIMEFITVLVLLNIFTKVITNLFNQIDIALHPQYKNVIYPYLEILSKSIYLYTNIVFIILFAKALYNHDLWLIIRLLIICSIKYEKNINMLLHQCSTYNPYTRLYKNSIYKTDYYIFNIGVY